MAAYATVAQYREQVPEDTSSTDTLVQAKLDQQSAKLRGECRIEPDTELSEDALTLAQFLVIDAASKALAPSSFEGFGDLSGATQASFSANGFQQSFTLQNPSKASYFDTATLRAFKKLIGATQRIGICAPFYGGK